MKCSVSPDIRYFCSGNVQWRRRQQATRLASWCRWCVSRDTPTAHALRRWDQSRAAHRHTVYIPTLWVVKTRALCRPATIAWAMWRLICTAIPAPAGLENWCLHTTLLWAAANRKERSSGVSPHAVRPRRAGREGSYRVSWYVGWLVSWLVGWLAGWLGGVLFHIHLKSLHSLHTYWCLFIPPSLLSRGHRAAKCFRSVCSMLRWESVQSWQYLFGQQPVGDHFGHVPSWQHDSYRDAWSSQHVSGEGHIEIEIKKEGLKQ